MWKKIKNYLEEKWIWFEDEIIVSILSITQGRELGFITLAIMIVVFGIPALMAYLLIYCTEGGKASQGQFIYPYKHNKENIAITTKSKQINQPDLINTITRLEKTVDKQEKNIEELSTIINKLTE